jgi:hypothetical protein
MAILKMGLFKKILLLAFVPFLIFSGTMVVSNLLITRASFEKVVGQFQGAMQDMRGQTSSDFMRMSEQSAREREAGVRNAEEERGEAESAYQITLTGQKPDETKHGRDVLIAQRKRIEAQREDA